LSCALSKNYILGLKDLIKKSLSFLLCISVWAILM
jgi:hypothetical protein